jgi:hypothetical protein
MPKNLWRLVRGKRRIGEAVQAHGYDGGSEEGVRLPVEKQRR